MQPAPAGVKSISSLQKWQIGAGGGDGTHCVLGGDLVGEKRCFLMGWFSSLVVRRNGLNG